MSARFPVRGDSNNPYHLSIGGVLLIDGNVSLVKKTDGIITLPRETMNSDESITDTLIRGFEEELGVTVTVSKFLGSLTTHFNRPDGTEIEKTTLYFLVNYESNTQKNQSEDEINDEIIELSLPDAINILDKQQNEEVRILRRVV